MKYQSAFVEMHNLVPYWLNNLPLTHDMEEAHIQNEYLAQAVLKSPNYILGQQYERLEQFVVILGEICCKKQSEPDTLDMLSVIVANISQEPNLAMQFKTLCENKLNEENRSRILEVYNKCNQEVRNKVQVLLSQI